MTVLWQYRKSITFWYRIQPSPIKPRISFFRTILVKAKWMKLYF